MFLTLQICCDIALDSSNAFPMVPCTLPTIFVTKLQISQFYHSTTLFIMQFSLQLVEIAVCFTTCMIQCVFYILIYSLNHYWDVLAPIYMPVPSEVKWISIADEFYERWNFPNCIVAIDSKHVMIQCPKFTGQALAS